MVESSSFRLTLQQCLQGSNDLAYYTYYTCIRTPQQFYSLIALRYPPSASKNGSTQPADPSTVSAFFPLSVSVHQESLSPLLLHLGGLVIVYTTRPWRLPSQFGKKKEVVTHALNASVRVSST